jgi:DNA-directed RNA polymerase subunit RPC12/RpoP
VYNEKNKNGEEKEMAMIRCMECGHGVSTTAERCPNCGARVVKKKANSGALDIICLITMVLACFMILSPFALLGYSIELIWMIVYQIIYRSAIKNPELDSTSLKKTRNTVAILFLLSNFGVVITVM